MTPQQKGNAVLIGQKQIEDQFFRRNCDKNKVLVKCKRLIVTIDSLLTTSKPFSCIHHDIGIDYKRMTKQKR